MKTIKLIPYFLIAFLCCNAIHAQRSRQVANEDRTGQWFLGLGLNVVEDSHNLFKGGPSFNISNPIILDVEYTYDDKFSFFGSIATNKYVAGKTIDSRIIQTGGEANYTAFDFGTNYYFREQLRNHMFEPYVTAGFGYTSIGNYTAIAIGFPQVLEIPTVKRVTFNPGIGVNYWFSYAWGLNANGILKLANKSKDFVSHQVQFSFGAVYSFE